RRQLSPGEGDRHQPGRPRDQERAGAHGGAPGEGAGGAPLPRALGGTWGDRELGALVSRLDGLPLAIELAAARSRVFEPEELVSELERGFSVLASIATDSRYQTLEGAINWSYQLLDPTDRDLLAAVTVFQGGFSLEAAKRVCAGSPHVAPSLARLVDH